MRSPKKRYRLIFTVWISKPSLRVFTQELPEVVYIAPEDFLNHTYTVKAVQTKNADGTYSVTSKNGTMLVDPNADTITYENFEQFVLYDIDSEGSATFSDYTKTLPPEQTGDIAPLTLDLADYGIDVIEYDGKVYMPLPTLNDIHAVTYNSAEYIDGNIYFTHSIDYANGVSYYDRSSLYNTVERTPAMADFTYRELCFLMDHFYGKPSLANIAPGMQKDEFDSVLDTYSEKTAAAKRLLKSTSKKDYFLGLSILSYEFFDGGHTSLIADFFAGSKVYPDSPIAQYSAKVISDPETDDENMAAMGIFLFMTKSVERMLPQNDKTLALQKYTAVKEWKDGTIKLYIQGDTAVFCFDSFVNEVVHPFKWSLDYAKEQGVKNFVVDLSTNGGGSTGVLDYMMAILTNKVNHSNVYHYTAVVTVTGNLHEEYSQIDLNLDGVFDDRDKDVVYDFNFAVLTTMTSYSCGNLMPVMCKDNGICVLGEKSGGGSCQVILPFSPESHFFSLSAPEKLVSDLGLDVDRGAPVDYELVETKTVTDESGTQETKKDYSKLYDFDLVGSLVTEFYAPNARVWGDVDGDGSITIADATAVQKYVIDLPTATSRFIADVADVNGDGRVSILDVTCIQKYIAEYTTGTGRTGQRVA